MGPEKRKSLRINKQLDAQYCNLSDNKVTWITLKVNNISDSGACVLIDRFPMIGEEITLRLRTPMNPGEWFQVNAKVVDVDKYMKNTYLARLNFTSVKEENKKRITEYIDFYLKRGNYQ